MSLQQRIELRARRIIRCKVQAKYFTTSRKWYGMVQASEKEKKKEVMDGGGKWKRATREEGEKRERDKGGSEKLGHMRGNYYKIIFDEFLKPKNNNNRPATSY